MKEVNLNFKIKDYKDYKGLVLCGQEIVFYSFSNGDLFIYPLKLKDYKDDLLNWENFLIASIQLVEKQRFERVGYLNIS